MRFRLTPRSDGFYRLFSHSADNLTSGAALLGKLLHAAPEERRDLADQLKKAEEAALELSGPERDRYYDRAVEIYPGCRHYERWEAPRRIRVLRLRPAVGDNVRGTVPKPRSPSE